jgi:hypothetical protein
MLTVGKYLSFDFMFPQGDVDLTTEIVTKLGVVHPMTRRSSRLLTGD